MPALYDPSMVCTLVAAGSFLINSRTGQRTGAEIHLDADQARIILNASNTIIARKHEDGLFHLDY